MITMSSKFQAAVVSSHTVTSKVSVYSDQTWIQDLAVLTGFVTVSSTNANRRTCSLTLTDPTGLLSPALASDLLAPTAGNELRIWKGIDYLDGTTELIPLGIFRISRCTVEDSGDGLTFTIIGYDRARKVQRAQFTDTYTLAAGMDVYTAIQTIVNSQTPGYVFNINPSSGFTIPQTTYDAGTDPWDSIQQLSISAGVQTYFDTSGVINVQPIPDIALAPIVWTFAEGPNAIILDLASDWSDESVFNYFIVTGESTGNAAPVRAVAYDNNPSSATYYLGKYGTVVAPILKSNLITSTAQAQAAANGLLNILLGQLVGLRFSNIVVPGLDAFDCVMIQRAISRVNYRFLLDQITIPLESDQAMQCTARRAGIV